jgi:hypothetical protein
MQKNFRLLGPFDMHLTVCVIYILYCWFRTTDVDISYT